MLRQFHRVVQNPFDGTFSRGVQVRAGASPLGDDRPLFVREQTNGFRAAGVDAENVHASLILCYAPDVSCPTPFCVVRSLESL